MTTGSLLLQLLLAVASLRLGQSTGTTAYRLPNPLERYDLSSCALHADGSIPAQKGNYSLIGTLIPSDPNDLVCQNAAVCPFVGRTSRAVRMQSNQTLVNFRNHFQQVGLFSLAMWITPTGSIFSGLRPVLTLGSHNAQNTTSAASTDSIAVSTSRFYSRSNGRDDYSTTSSFSSIEGCSGYDFRLAQLDNTLLISFTNLHGMCVHVRPNQLMLNDTLTHVAIAFGLTDMHVYIDGILVPIYRDDDDNTGSNGDGSLESDNRNDGRDADSRGDDGRGGDGNRDGDGNRNDNDNDVIMTVDIPQWNSAEAGTLTLFSNHDDDGDNVFLGSISQVELYDQALTAGDSAMLYALGVAYTQPSTQPPSSAPLIAWTASPMVAPTQMTTAPPVTRLPTVAPNQPPVAPTLSPITPFPSLVPNSEPSDGPSSAPSKLSTVPSLSPVAIQFSASPSWLRTNVIPTVGPRNAAMTGSIDIEGSSSSSSRLEWQSVAFIVIGSAMTLFCIFSVFGGWPRLVASRRRRGEQPVFFDEHAIPA